MLYKASDIDFTVGTPVISRAQKFIIPVPADKENAEPLVYPIEAGEKAGKPITDWEGNIIEGEGLVFIIIKITLGRQYQLVVRRSLL